MSDERELSVEVTDDYLVVKVPRNNPPKLSATGKSLVVASTYGNQQITTQIDGKNITIGVNAYIKAK